MHSPQWTFINSLLWSLQLAHYSILFFFFCNQAVLNNDTELLCIKMCFVIGNSNGTYSLKVTIYMSRNFLWYPITIETVEVLCRHSNLKINWRRDFISTLNYQRYKLETGYTTLSIERFFSWFIMRCDSYRIKLAKTHICLR